MKSNIKKGIEVKILTGKDKGKKGEVIEVSLKKGRVIVKGINFVKKHVKSTKEKKGGIISKENIIHISNVAPTSKNEDKKENEKDLKKKVKK